MTPAAQRHVWAAALGAVGAGLNGLRGPLWPGAPPELALGDAAALVAFALLGPGPGLLAAALTLPGLLAGPGPAPLLSHVLSIAGMALVHSRTGSLILAAAVYWSTAGWLIDLPLRVWLGPAGDLAADEVFVQRAAAGILAGVLGEASLLARRLHRRAGSAEPRRPVTMASYLLRQVLLAVIGPLSLAGIVWTRLAHATGRPASDLLELVILTLAAALLLGIALIRATGGLARPLVGLARAVDGTGNPSRPVVSPDHDLALGPVEEIQSLASAFRRMHESLAHYDAVTRLPNLKLFRDRLALATAQSARTRDSFALLVVDLDRYRLIDGSLGREAADEVLGRIARRLEECVRPGDTVARIGGDEFALLIPRMGRIEEAAEMAVKVMDNVKRAFVVAGREVFVTATVGTSLYPRDGQDAETLLKNATAATYAAKERGQDTYRRYTARISKRDAERLMVESGLRRALERDELLLHYQPVVDLATGVVPRVEALLRWDRPGQGLAMPKDFIPVAEASGLITSLDTWTLRRACAELGRLPSAGGLGVSVNLSARQFQQPDLVEQVRHALGETQLAPERLAIEITEGVAMQDVDRTLETLTGLRDLGTSIFVDDFGTGYSSLSYLRRFPVDVLKLDQSFVRDVTTNPDDAAIATAVIAMAHSLKLKVVAEGVETEDQLAFLEERGCDAIQGFLYSPPLPMAELAEFLSRPRRLPNRRA